MRTSRTPRSVQLPLLKTAALSLAKRLGETIIVSNLPVTQVKCDTLLMWLTPMGTHTAIEVWDESRGGAKVLNLWITDTVRSMTHGTSTTTSTGYAAHSIGSSHGTTEHRTDFEVVSFKRGDWEETLLRQVKQIMH